MSMEKNGAISSNTPGCKNNCGCAKQAEDLVQGGLFPESIKQADAIDGDLTKQAVDTVRHCSKPSR